jgi:WhiB family redox-sensing transcriptional regulator
MKVQILNFDLDQEAWMEEGSCVYANTELFFPVGSSMKAIKQSNEAKAICNECVVKIDCLEYAIRTNQDSGVWGGTTEEERKSLRREYRKNGSLLNF